MRISLIVTTYNRPDALMLVLKSIQIQSLKPTEVIIADDGSNNQTRNLILEFAEYSDIEIIHSYQDDLGFRAAESRNKAIAIAKSEYIILIDGDMILHHEFVRDHVNNSKLGYFIQGSRVLLNKNKTRKVLKGEQKKLNFFSIGLNNRLNSIYSNFLSKLFSINSNHLKGIKTCNLSFYRKDFLSVNGFNNEFKGWGREDSEFVSRLLNKGINRKTIKFTAIQFHLWHDESNREYLMKNDFLLQKAIDENLVWCDQGINKFL